MEPALAIAALHGLLLRELAAQAQRHFEGLAQAARFYKDILSPQQRKKLIRLDQAYNITRHYTQPRFDTFYQEIPQHSLLFWYCVTTAALYGALYIRRSEKEGKQGN